MYTDKELIHQLQDLYERLDRSPKIEDIRKDIYTATDKTFANHFGSVSIGRKKAGIPEPKHNHRKGRPKKYNKKELIKKLKLFSKRKCNGNTPTIREVSESNFLPDSKTYWDYFGSYAKACSLAGLRPNRKGTSERGRLINTI